MNDISINMLSEEKKTLILFGFIFSENLNALNVFRRPSVCHDRISNYEKDDHLGGLVFISFRCI